MIRREEVYKIGRLGKTHGVRGEISFLLDDDVFDRTDADYLILDIDGILVPFFIEEYRFKTDSNALMKFDGIDTQERYGINILFELTDGKLIPASEELIQQIDTKRHQIEINLPQGILEL